MTNDAPQTLACALLAVHTDDPVEPGRIVRARVDFAFANDITAPPAIRALENMGAKSVFDPARAAVVIDHFTPNKDIESAKQVKVCRDFAKRHGVWFWEMGRVGVEHALLPEAGLILPGDLIVGADSHTCTGGALGAFATGMGSTDLAAVWALGETWLRVPESIRVDYVGACPPWIGGKDLILETIGRLGVDGARYQALEFAGDALAALPLDDRFTMANMAVEAGAKVGLFVPDAATLAYASVRARRAFTPVYPSAGACYAEKLRVEVGGMDPVVALPHRPDRVKAARACGDLRVDQVFIGSCTNGRLRDLALAAAVLRGRKAHKDTRLIVIPASVDVYRAALEKGYVQTFLDAGAVICTPSCGPCLGGHLGILAPGERCLSTSNRNFVGRMGAVDSEVVLAGPLTAAAGAVLGRVADPRELLGDEAAVFARHLGEEVLA